MREYFLPSFIYLFLTLAPLFAHENLKFNHLTIENGLSQNTVNAIAQDRTGFLWIATQDGLNKFNGIDFTHYKNDSTGKNCISENNIYCLYIDRNDIMWIGTRGRGLNRFDLKTETFSTFLYDPARTDSISDNFIYKIYGDPDDSILWIGTENNGLNRFDTIRNVSEKFVHSPDDPDSISGNKITALYRDSKGILWIGTEENGLNMFMEKENRFSRFFHGENESSGLSDNTINAIYEDRCGNLWIGTRNGLNLRDRQTGNFIVYRHQPGNTSSLCNNRVTDIFEDSGNRLWIGTEDGLSIFDRERQVFHSYREQAARKFSLSNNNIMKIFEDDTGTLWFGTFTGGLNKLAAAKFVHIEKEPLEKNSLPQNSIWAIFSDSAGIVWLGTENQGLCRWDREKNLFKTYTHAEKNPETICSNVVQAVCEDSEKRLWIGTDSGLNLLNRETNRFTRFLTDEELLPSLGCNDIMKIVEGRDGKLWLATYGGIGIFDPEKRQCSFLLPVTGHNSLSHKRVRTLFQDSDGIFWFGTETGLNRYDPITGVFTLFAHDPEKIDSLSHDRIYSITEDREGLLWVSTKNGLNRFDKKTGKFVRYTEKNGLSNNTIYGVLIEREGGLWMSTNNGLNLLIPHTGEIRTFSVDDGLQSNEFNMGAYYQTAGGEMFFGGINGFNTFFPDKIGYNKRKPPVILSTFRKLDKVVLSAHELSKTRTIELSYKDNFFSFEFAALDFVAPLKNRYAYMMEGFDHDWIYCGNRRYAAYTNLSGGRFTFRVKASNNDGIWNETGTSIEIVIPPPPWKTWWAYCLYVLSVFGIFYLYLLWEKIQHKREMSFQKMLNDAANRFVPHEYFSILGKKDILDVNLGDQVQKDMTIFFSDIRSFTNISEKLTPKENFDFINEYLSRVGPVIRKQHGFIDKYIGDAVMALFEKSADNAIDAALDSLKAVEDFNNYRRERNEEAIKIGIGLNTGTLMLGTVGERHRINATVIADAVNLASRIEGQTKTYGVEILITENTREKILRPGDYLIRSIDKIQVKGKDEAVSIYEVFNGLPDRIRDFRLSVLHRYEEAYSLYYVRKFAEAGKLFRECLKEGIEDGCVNMYLERCNLYETHPPPENWDGITKLDNK